ncbi:MAG: phosphate/phosphite/phosphonate ABC transporter substrate-binding protein [Polyangiaceae bacterium]|jgi:phosphonate transport system substrate-binding protein
MLGSIRLGLIPLGEGGDARIHAFIVALAEAVGTPIDLHHAADYRALTSAIEQGLVHFAWLPPLSAARAVRSGAITPAAVAVRHGTTSYYAGLVALESSSIHSISDLKGLRAAWVDRESASGYVVIRAALRQQGVSLVDAFSQDLFLRSHAEVARAVDQGLADVGATCFNLTSGDVKMARSTYTGMIVEPLKNMRIVAEAGPIPSDMFAVHKSISPVALQKIQTALIGARPVHFFEAAKAMMFADSFARADAEHLRMLESLYDSVLSNDAPRSLPPSRIPSSYPPR